MTEETKSDHICVCQEAAANINTYEILDDDERLKRAKEVQALVKKFKISEQTGAYRCPAACDNGGFTLLNDD